MKRNTLVACRVTFEKTQAQAAEDLSISEVYLRMLEAGTRNPGRDLTFKISEYYGKSAQELFPDIFQNEIMKTTANEQAAASA